MARVNTVITSEYVSYGHPDKIADQIADAIVDAFIIEDPNARCGIEVMVKDNVVVLGGEVHSLTNIDYNKVVRRVFDNLDFPANHNLQSENIKILNLIGQQSTEIHNGVDKTEEDIGAGDQGFAVGYANNETSVYLPIGHYLAKLLCQKVAQEFGPDTKTQVVVEYDKYGNATVSSILVSTMHQNSLEDLRLQIQHLIMYNRDNVFPNDIWTKYIKDKQFTIDINPCGEWRIGGPISDCGVTGRKLVVDTYGGYCNIGGGAQCGKDFSKVDRSAAYMCRYLAKNIVASGITDEAKVELAYVIGQAEPIAFNINMSSNQNKVSAIKRFIQDSVSLTPLGIMRRFDNTIPRNYQTARNGLFGYNVAEDNFIYPWEKTDIANALKIYLQNKNN